MNDVQKSLRDRYPDLHPLLFLRSKEKAATDGQLFDLLESLPPDHPIVWDDDKKCWVHTTDLLQGDAIRKDTT